MGNFCSSCCNNELKLATEVLGSGVQPAAALLAAESPSQRHFSKSERESPGPQLGHLGPN